MDTAAKRSSTHAAGDRFAIVYDGDCPFCAAYIRLLRLRLAAGEPELIDARSSPAVVAELRAAGHEINDGMVVIRGGQLHHGDDAMHVLALMSTRSGLFNRLAAALFAQPQLARALYPIFKAGRLAALKLLGRPPI